MQASPSTASSAATASDAPLGLVGWLRDRRVLPSWLIACDGREAFAQAAVVPAEVAQQGVDVGAATAQQADVITHA
jgi:hypothetical protein